MSYHYTYIKMAKIKKIGNSKHGGGCRARLHWWEYAMGSPLRESRSFS